MSEEDINNSTDESDSSTTETKKVQDKDKILRLFPLRLGFFTGLFLTFFFVTAIFLNVAEILAIAGIQIGGYDLFDIIIFLLQTPSGIFPINIIYPFIIPTTLVNQAGLQAIYISTSLILTFFTVSIFCSNDSIRHVIFRKSRWKTFLIQIGVFLLIFAAYLHVLNSILFVGNSFGFGGNFVAQISIVIIIIAEIAWLIIQTWSLFAFSRSGATNAEQYMSSHESGFIYGIVRIAPFWCLIGISFLSAGYFLMIQFAPFILPSLLAIRDVWSAITILSTALMITVCIIPFIITTATKKANRRQRAYDSFTFVFSTLLLYPYILFNFALYFLLNLQIGAGAGGTLLGTILIWTEMILVMAMMMYSMRKVGVNLEYEYAVFEKEGFVLAIYAAIMGQFALRYVLVRGQVGVIITGVPLLNFLVNSGSLIIAFGALLAISVSLVLMRTKRFAKTFKLHRKVSKEDEKRIEAIYDYLKREYIRRGGIEFPVPEVDSSLQGIFRASKFEVARLINLSDQKYDDLRIEGIKKRYVYFLKDTTQYVPLLEED